MTSRLSNRHLGLLMACVLSVGLALLFVAAPAHAAPALQASGAFGVAQYDQVNVRTGPSTAYPTVGQMSLGQSCPILGRDTYSGWYLLQCSATLTGWVSPDLIAIVGNPATIPLYSIGGPTAPPEQQVPPPATYAGWKASYFANKDLQGSPVLIQDVQAINFDWGYGSPGPQVPTDYFSARYERTLTLSPGYYYLNLRMDDGARLLIDNQPVISDWRVGSLRDMNTVRYFDGAAHSFVVEYFEDTGLAAIQFTYTPSSGPPPGPGTGPQPPPAGNGSIPQNQWLAQYYNNTDLVGDPVYRQYVPRGAYPLDQDWGMGSPAPNITADYFSIRFEGSFYFDAGDYQFFSRADDGVRVYIDSLILIDAWYDGYKEPNNIIRSVGAGWHTIRVDFYERVGTAFVRVWWNRIN